MENRYRVREIEQFDVTRNLVLQSLNSGREYLVFDDSDILGDNQFSFMKRDGEYECSIGIFGELAPTGEEFRVTGHATIGHMKLIQLQSGMGDRFYLPQSQEAAKSRTIHVTVLRYDLLAVAGEINDRSIEGITGRK